MDDKETCSWCTDEVLDSSLVEIQDGARICPQCVKDFWEEDVQHDESVV